jgi:mycothiol system anti-sigma-R factor
VDERERPSCEEALTELYTFLDGELTTEKREHIRVHLNDCAPCLEHYDFEAELRIVISAKCRESVPETLKERIAARLADLQTSELRSDL